MTRIERQRLLKTSLLTATVIALVVATQWAGALVTLERWLNDLRIKHCQFFTPAPTDQIIHLDIDDPTIEAVARWPWHRAVLAQMVDELGTAGAKCIAFDVFFPEPQDQRWTPDPLHDGQFIRINDDAVFAEALRNYGRALVAVSFKPREPIAPTRAAAADILRDNLELSFSDLTQSLSARKSDEALAPLDANGFYAARRLAFSQRLTELFAGGGGAPDFAAAQRALIPHASETFTSSPLHRVMSDEWRRVSSFYHLERFAKTIPPGLPPMLSAQGDAPPVPLLSAAAAQTGFVDFLSESDGIVRSVPLWVNYHGRAFPQIGLALACMQLDVDPRDIILAPDRVTIPRTNAPPIVIPVRTIHSPTLGGEVGFVTDLSWFGSNRWETMYDAPRFKEPSQHLPLSQVWSIIELRDRIRRNNASADAAIKALLYVLDESRLAQYEKHTLTPDDTEARNAEIAAVLRDADGMGFYDAYANLPPAQLKPDEAIILRSIRALRVIPDENAKLLDNIARQRSTIRGKVAGRAVLIGHTASGTLDVINTPLHAHSPGVITHGVLFNAILTGEFWSHAPPWVDALTTAAVGGIAAIAILTLSPATGFLVALLIAAAYSAFNGILLFDYGNTVVTAAGPLVAIIVVWSTATLARFIIERRERTRITGRFRSYVDPALVAYVLEHPDQARLDGQVREMTVVFTDLAGFTTLSERLREKTVAILNQYMALMVPVITRRRGFVNKFLGDGIMFFFNAPEPNPDHAADAILTVMHMQEVLTGFNETLIQRGLPTVAMRVGINTGAMIVGDAGGAERSDYTVIGDDVNLAARLESANKTVGSRMLVTARTVELAGGDRFLFRPIGRLQVVGKTQGVMTFEPLAESAHATDAQRRLAALSGDVVQHFQNANFAAGLVAVNNYTATIGEDRFATVYRELCEQYLAAPPANFNGVIVLTEK